MQKAHDKRRVLRQRGSESLAMKFNYNLEKSGIAQAILYDRGIPGAHRNPIGEMEFYDT